MYDEVRNPETVRGQKTKLISLVSDIGAPVNVKRMPAAVTGGDLSRIFTSFRSTVSFRNSTSYVLDLHLPLCIGILLTAYCLLHDQSETMVRTAAGNHLLN